MSFSMSTTLLHPPLELDKLTHHFRRGDVDLFYDASQAVE